jgi:hypothetical protein
MNENAIDSENISKPPDRRLLLPYMGAKKGVRQLSLTLCSCSHHSVRLPRRPER